MQDNKNELFEKISNEYSMLLLNWAYKKLGNRTNAEDLAQEVMLQIFYAAIKEDKIEKLDNFVWRVAHYVWCNHLRTNKSYNLHFPIDTLSVQSISEPDYAEKFADDEEMKENIKKMRVNLSRLNCLQREVMIMHYIDGMPIKVIAEKLNVIESNIKRYLYDARKKIKKEIEEMENIQYIYRPGRLSLSYSGKSGSSLDIHKINENLARQNICLCCYQSPKTLDDLSETLGIPKAYIEFDLKWLVEREFIQEKKNKYYTMFSIVDINFLTQLFKIFTDNKTEFSDIIIQSFREREEKIKSINFHGAEQPIEKLLWLLIYSFTDYMTIKFINEDGRYSFEAPIRLDGGKYFPIGYDLSDNNIVFELDKKYREISNWDYNGSMGSEHFYWVGLYNAGGHQISQVFNNNGDNPYGKILLEISKDNFNTDNLTDDEKFTLGEVIKYGWVNKTEDKLIPNFYIFTSEQNNILYEIFAEIYDEIKPYISGIGNKIERLCKTGFPAHLPKSYFNHFIFMAFIRSHVAVTGISLCDGKIYEPKDENECGLLTFKVITDQ